MKSRPKVISVVGARPQFIKLATLSRKLNKKFNHKLIHTGQHYDKNMSGIFFDQLQIPKAHINLKIGGSSHGAMTGAMLEKLEKQFERLKPDMVIVYGDTNSTLAGALAAAKLGIPISHVEAGLRSFDKNMPEEINRLLTDHVSRLLFCPTTAAIKNLKNEGISKGIVYSGDLMYEQIDQFRKEITKNRWIERKYGLNKNSFYYLTFHRASNTDSLQNLNELIAIIKQTSLPVLFAMHPRTKKRLKQFKLLKKLSAIESLIITSPVSYLDSLAAAYNAKAVLTDSGGLQKEALFLGTPVLTLRNETEWVETLKIGNQLVGLSRRRVSSSLKKLPTVRKIEYKIKNKKPSDIIIAAISKFLREEI